MNRNRIESRLRRQILWAAATVPAWGLLPAAGRAETKWPLNTVTIVIGYPPGGGTENVARLIGHQLTARHGRPVIVESRPGASGTIAVAHVARSPADGYTLLLSQLGLVTSPHVMPKQAQGGVDVLTDLVPVGQLSSGSLALVVSSSLNVANVQELVAYLKKNPGTVYASSGQGSILQFAGEVFRQATNVDLVHVAYKGSAPLMVDIAGGHVKLGFIDLATGLPYIQSGQARFLGVAQKTRSPLMPDLPTLAEQGVDVGDLRTWFGMFAPKGTPATLVEPINREVSVAMTAPEVVNKLKALGDAVHTTGPKEFDAFVKSQYAFYGSLAREFGIQAE